MKGAVVTGGARGLGLAIAHELARRSYRVLVTDVDAEAAERASSEVGPSAAAAGLDVRDAAACREVARGVESLDLWVNNAGVLVTGPAWEQDEDARRLMHEVNYTGTVNGTLAALERMRGEGGGHILNVISLAGIVAAPGETVYGASKHAAIAFSLGTLADLRRAGIRDVHISCLCPDGIWTPMLHDKLEDPQAAASFSGRLLLPNEVAARVGRLVEKPRPVVVMPAWRGVLLRLFDAFPRLMLRGLGPTLRLARLQQRMVRRRVLAGRWPPR